MNEEIFKNLLANYTQKANLLIDIIKRDELKEIRPIGAQPFNIADYFFKLSIPGKKLRGCLMYLMYKSICTKATKLDLANTLRASLAIEFFHTGILIHDDIIDKSDLRRGLPTLEKRFNTNNAICAGDYAFYLSWEILLNCGLETNKLLNAGNIYSKYVMRLINGQLLELSNLHNNKITRAKILKIMTLKSGEYTFELPLLMGYALAGGQDTDEIETIKNYSKYAGWIFQTVDDYLGIFGNATVAGKPCSTDLKEGKHTLYTYLLNKTGNTTYTNFINNKLGNPNVSEADTMLYKQYLTESGIKNKVFNLVNSYAIKAEKQLTNKNLNPNLKLMLGCLTKYLVKRTN